MDAADVRKLLLTGMGMRIEPEMSNYLATKMTQSNDPVNVMGEDARTGTPVYQQINRPQITERYT